ncbi:hypothetical protein ABBQ32_007578 [Trebouxia sp. C0010 RCD-2024]
MFKELGLASSNCHPTALPTREQHHAVLPVISTHAYTTNLTVTGPQSSIVRCSSIAESKQHRNTAWPADDSDTARNKQIRASHPGVRSYHSQVTNAMCLAAADSRAIGSLFSHHEKKKRQEKTAPLGMIHGETQAFFC